jgi:hypothetical protein
MPLHHPAVRRYVAVDEVCIDRLVREEGIPPSRVELLLNFVDLDRFRPRPPLPGRPARALVLSNAATPDGYARVVAEACRRAGITLDVVGLAAGNASNAPETLLPAYDLVFAKGRTVLEALAVGCAAVLADAAGAGPLVTPENFGVLRARNFGIRELTHIHDAEWYASQIAQYRAPASAAVSARVRAEAGIEPAMDRLLDIYSAARAAPPGAGDALQATAAYCSRIARPLKEAHGLARRVGILAAELQLARAELDARSNAAGECGRQLAAARADLRALESQVAAYRALPTLRLRDALLRAPVVGPVLQASVRHLARLLL